MKSFFCLSWSSLFEAKGERDEDPGIFSAVGIRNVVDRFADLWKEKSETCGVWPDGTAKYGRSADAERFVLVKQDFRRKFQTVQVFLREKIVQVMVFEWAGKTVERRKCQVGADSDAGRKR